MIKIERVCLDEEEATEQAAFIWVREGTWKVCERKSVNSQRWEGSRQGCASLVYPLQGPYLVGVSSSLVLGFPLLQISRHFLKKLPQVKFGYIGRSLSYKTSFGLTGLICSEVLHIYCPFLFILILSPSLLSIWVWKQGAESRHVSRVAFEPVV